MTYPRGRPVLNDARTTFVADNGRLLRGPYTSGEWGDPAPYEELANMKDLGFNAIHIYGECFDINYPNQGSTAPGYSADRLDAIVQATGELGLYLVITIGNGANNGNYNIDYVTDFWEFYAPRYADETHVLYEIQNEPVAWSPPYSTASNGALDMEISVYNLIRSHAPETPVLLFSYSVLWGEGGGNDALNDIRIFNQAVFGSADAVWENLAVAFHGYAGAQNTADAVEIIMDAGYPTVMTEFHGGMWGSDVGGLDVELTYQLERLEVSWLAFVYVPPWGVSDDVSIPEVYADRVTMTGLSWRPDFGSFPAVRGTYGNGGVPWETPGYVDGHLGGTLRIEAEDFDEGGRGVAYDNDSTSPASTYRFSETVQVESTMDAGGGYHVGGNTAGDWLEFTLKVDGAGVYDIRLRMAGEGSVRIYSRDEDLTGVWLLPNTGGTGVWSTADHQVFLPGGLQRLRLQVEAGDFNLNWIELSPVSNGPIPEGTHQIRNAGTGQSLNMDGANNVVVDTAARNWEFQHSGAAQYTVGANGDFWTTFMGPLHLTPWWGAERFILDPIGNGNYRIVHGGNGLCFVPSTSDGPLLTTAVCGDDENQQWIVE